MSRNDDYLYFGIFHDEDDGRPLVDCEGGPKPEYAEDADLADLVRNQLHSIDRQHTRLWVGEQDNEHGYPLVDDNGKVVAAAWPEDLAYRIAAITQEPHVIEEQP